LKKLETEDYFSLAAAFGFVALLCFVLPARLLDVAVNTDTFRWGYFIYAQGEREINIYYSTLTTLIFIPSAYLSIGFVVGGTVKALLLRAKKTRKHMD
jgi:hypothetical protein